MEKDYYKNLSKTKKVLLIMTLISVLSALSFVATYIQIPFPSINGRQMIHLGNLSLIVSSVIFGGIIGGLSGSIGMGLYDVINGYDIFSITRTIILKFIVGFIVGIIFNILKKQKTKNINIYIIIISMIFLTIGAIFTYLSITSNFNTIVDNKGEIVKIYYFPTYIMSYLVGIYMLVSQVIFKKSEHYQKAINISISIGLVINIVGEFIYKLLKQMIVCGNDFKESFMVGLFSLPTTTINATITLILSLLVILPLYKTFKKSIEYE